MFTHMSLYDFYENVNKESLQILTEAPPSISKFESPYRSLYVSNSPYLILSFKQVRNVKPLRTLQIMDHEINERTSIDQRKNKYRYKST